MRLHTGPKAHGAARNLSARAFTVGKSIAFGAGEYQPESREGRKLLAHELTHTVQQGAAGVVRRKPKTAEDADSLHDSIVEQYRREEGLPLSGKDPQTGAPVGPSRGQIKYGNWPGDVAAPNTAPTLAPVPEALSEASCGKVLPGMDPKAAEKIADCISHSRFVNFANQAAANIALVPTPYAPAIAAAYRAVIAEVVKAGTGGGPPAGGSKSFSVTGLTASLGSGVSLPVASFELKLFRQPNGANGVAFGNGIELNEESNSAIMAGIGDSAARVDIERTMYHEGFHWLSGVAGENNRQVRAGLTQGTIVRPELDHNFVSRFEAEFRAAAEPLWTDILAQVPVQPGNSFKLTPQTLSGIQWIKVSNEILSRIEEVVYLRQREGKGFSRRFDLPALDQKWLRTSDYWDSGVIFVRFHLQKFLDTHTGRIDAELLPAVQKIQREFLKRR